MGIGPHNKQNRPLRAVGNVSPLRKESALVPEVKSPHHDEFFDHLVPALEEAVGLRVDESPRQETADLLRLLEENARLRKLAVQLSNLLGDLPRRD